MIRAGLKSLVLFLSTPSVRRATMKYSQLNYVGGISIHALREEGDRQKKASGKKLEISIHALREEGDEDLAKIVRHYQISIHALREEGDLLS